MTKILNDQIAMEASASNNYLSMASWCETTGYEGATNFFYNHADEERQRMLKIIHYLNGVGTSAVIPNVRQPLKTFKSLESICKTALKNEQAVTASINTMVELAQKEKDHTTFDFLQWYVKEQLEEEGKLESILQKFVLIGRDKTAIYEINKALGAVSTN